MSWERGGERTKKKGREEQASACYAHACASERREGGKKEGVVMRKRVMVVIDRTARAKHAMMWALTHVANKGDVMTLLHVLPPHCSASAHREEETSHLINSLGSMCKAMRPQVITGAGPHRPLEFTSLIRRKDWDFMMSPTQFTEGKECSFILLSSLLPFLFSFSFCFYQSFIVSSPFLCCHW